MKPKKLFAVILSIALLISVLPIGGIGTLTVSAAKNSGYYTYAVSNGKATIFDVDESISGNITIPSTLGGYTVTSIGDSAFSGCKSLTGITIPNSVTRIGNSAFSRCLNLEKAIISDSVIKIGSSAFRKCENLISIEIGNGIENIGSSAFKECYELCKVNISNISDWCNIVFDNSYSNPLFYAKNLYLNEKLVENINISTGVEIVSDYAFFNCNSISKLTIGGSVKNIGNYAFKNCSKLKSVNFSNSVKSIGAYAFYGCGITNITLPNEIESINEYAFASCCNLKSINIGDGLGNISYGVFSDCIKLEKVTLGKNIGSIYIEAFKNCENLKTITIPKSVEKIYWGTFEGCENLEKIIVYSINCKFNKNCGIDFHYTIYGFKGSTAEKFAEKIGAEFIDVEIIHTHTYKTTTTDATQKANGKIEKKCTVCGKVSSSKVIRKIGSVKLSEDTYTYNGKAKTPIVTVKDTAGNKLVKNTDYTVKLASGRKNVGKYKVTVTFKGNYKGTKTLYFTINPAKTTVSKLTAGKKSIKVNITKKSTQVTGYEVQYSTSKTFKSAKTKTISSYKTTSATLSKLSAKKTYYVRVRTYKTVNGTKYYSGWSTYKYTKTK